MSPAKIRIPSGEEALKMLIDDSRKASTESAVVSSIQELITRVQSLPMKGEGWMYRGHSDCSYKLIPKAGRLPFCNINDLDFFNEWRRKAVAYLPTLPSDEWEALAIAQHHGLATRLLDWSFKYSVATYFAAKDQPETDGVIYCYYPRQFDIGPRPSLRELSATQMYSPPMNIPRILAQEAVFTCHPAPDRPLEREPDLGAHIFMLTIPGNAKLRFLTDLDALGINQASMFPDLDGLSGHMNWKVGVGRPVEGVLTRDLSKVLGHVFAADPIKNQAAAKEFIETRRQRAGE
jgi:hypothetical protein